MVAGPYADDRLVFDAVAAVPDLASALRDARGFARRARRREWETAVIVRVDGVESELVPSLVTAAARAGYRWVVSPWTPDPGSPPETVHAVYAKPTEICAEGVA